MKSNHPQPPGDAPAEWDAGESWAPGPGSPDSTAGWSSAPVPEAAGKPFPVVFVDRDADENWLTCIQVGFVADGLHAEQISAIHEHAAWLHHPDDEEREQPPIGILVSGTEVIDLSETKWAAFWDPAGPRFDAPGLALEGLLAGELVVAALAAYAEDSTINRHLYKQAIHAEDPEEALWLWRACVSAGDLTGHYAIGYTQYELGNYAAAYSHLSYYAEIARDESWVWCWLGRAAMAIGESDRAIGCWRVAVSHSDEPDQTDAAELLAEQGF